MPLLFVLAAASPAQAAYLSWADAYVPDEVLMLGLLLFAGLCLYVGSDDTSSSSNVARMSLDLPEEVQSPESVEYYDDMSARTRAL